MEFVTNPPAINSKTESASVVIPDIQVPDATFQDEALTAGFIMEPDGEIYPDLEWEAYKQRFGWEVANSRLEILAESLLSFAAQHTFSQFKHNRIGIVIELLRKTWRADAAHMDPNSLDSLPHLDWVSKQPTLLILGASPNQSVFYHGLYNYEGDLADTRGNVSYRRAVDTEDLLPFDSSPGTLRAGDGRRLIHARPLACRMDKPFPRSQLRAFVAEKWA